MKEINKTGIFVAIAAVVALGAVFTAPRISNPSTQEFVVKDGEELFGDKFNDPRDAANLKIVKYDETLDEFKTFEVRHDKTNGGWIIPSKENYLADATDQMSKAANMLIGLRVYGLASTKAEDQSFYGVVEPNPDKHKVGETGVGTLVQLQNDKGETLAGIIIGKADRDNPKRHFVRRLGEEPIYNVDIDMEPQSTPFTTDFSRWIDNDLLKLSSNDIESIKLRNYSIVIRPNNVAQIGHVFDADVSYSSSTGNWNADSIKVYQGAEATTREIGPDEQLNKTKLDEIKNSLDNLKIVDVLRKPNGLAANLKAETVLLNNRESQESLIRRGFIPNPAPDGSTEILSVNGEMSTTLNSGVQYVLRFGNAARSDGQSLEEADAENVSTGLNRYLMVSARVNEAAFPEPVLQRLPETIEEMKQIQQASQAAQLQGVSDKPDGSLNLPEIKLDGDNKTANPGEDSSAAPTTPPETKGDSTSGDQSSLVPASKFRFVAAQDGAAPTAGNQATQENKQEEKPADKEEANRQETEQELKEQLEAMREQLKKENDRKVEARLDKLKAAKKKVDELNARFADWYYVVSDAEYRKLRVDLKDLVQPKAAAPASPASPPGFGPGGLIPGN